MIKLPMKLDINRLSMAAFLIIVGVCGRILLVQYANIETVLAIAFGVSAPLVSAIIRGKIWRHLLETQPDNETTEAGEAA